MNISGDITNAVNGLRIRNVGPSSNVSGTWNYALKNHCTYLYIEGHESEVGCGVINVYNNRPGLYTLKGSSFTSVSISSMTLSFSMSWGHTLTLLEIESYKD